MTYQASLRAAVFDGVSASDVAEVVKGIAERAKKGDPKSIDQFFHFVVGARSGPKEITVNQHIHCESVEDSAKVARRINGLSR